jgi:hypothetical protein
MATPDGGAARLPWRGSRVPSGTFAARRSYPVPCPATAQTRPPLCQEATTRPSDPIRNVLCPHRREGGRRDRRRRGAERRRRPGGHERGGRGRGARTASSFLVWASVIRGHHGVPAEGGRHHHPALKHVMMVNLRGMPPNSTSTCSSSTHRAVRRLVPRATSTRTATGLARDRQRPRRRDVLGVPGGPHVRADHQFHPALVQRPQRPVKFVSPARHADGDSFNQQNVVGTPRSSRHAAASHVHADNQGQDALPPVGLRLSRQCPGKGQLAVEQRLARLGAAWTGLLSSRRIRSREERPPDLASVRPRRGRSARHDGRLPAGQRPGALSWSAS